MGTPVGMPGDTRGTRACDTKRILTGDALVAYVVLPEIH